MYYATLTDPARIVFLDGTEFIRGVEKPVTKEFYDLLKNRGNYFLRSEVEESDDLKDEETPETKDKKPKARQEVTDAILKAIGQLDVDAKDSFLSDGRPDARALSKVLGWQVTSNERDEALKAVAVAPARTGIIIRRKNAVSAEPIDTGEVRLKEERGDLTSADIDPTTDGAITV
jgi:hypothetical protein